MQKIREKLKSFKSVWLALLVIVLLGSFLRLYKLGEKSFVADEFLGVNASYGFLQTGQFYRWDFNLDKRMDDRPYPKSYFEFDIWKGGKDSYIRAWMYNWQVAQSLKFFSPEKESSYRLVSALWGIVLILLVFFVSKKLTGKKRLALIAAFFMATSLMSVEFSRKIRMYAMFAPVFFAFSYYLFKFLESKKETKIKFLETLNKKTGFNFSYFLPMALLGLLSAHLHPLALNAALAVVAYWVVMALIDFSKTKKFSNKYMAYLGVGLVSFLVLLLVSKEFIVFLGDFVKFLTHFSYFEIIFSDYSSWVLALVMMIIGSFFLIRKDQKSGVFLTVFFWSILLLAAFSWKSNVGDRFVYFIKPFQVVLLAGGVYAVTKYLENNLQKNAQKIVTGCLAVLLLAIPSFAGFFGDNGPYIQNSRTSEPNYRKVFDYFNKKKKAGDVLVTRDFRNFYFKDAKVKVFSLGGERTDKEERRIELKDIQKIVEENKCGWMIFSDSDENFISKEAEDYIAKNLPKVDNSSVRGPITVVRWCNNEQEL